jgi:hypothetical protein
MARMPGALWIGPTPNSTENGMSTIKGLVLHIEQGYESGSEAWFKNPDSRASAHFLNPKTGPLRQMVDTRDRAWAQAAGNPNWISVEHEGFVPDALTPSQVENDAQLFAWVCRTYDVPVQSTDSPAWRGLGWHGMGGDLWGGHPGCPGDAIKAQRPAILTRTHVLLGDGIKHVPFPGAAWFSMGRRSPVVAAMHDRLVAVGCSRYKSSANKDVIGSGDVASYEAWQRQYSATHHKGWTGAALKWPPGKETWDALEVTQM